MYTPRSVVCSCIRTRSPRIAPPVNGLDGSTASTPTRRPPARNCRTSSLVVVDLPTPGEPVSPTTWACPEYGASAAATSGSAGSPFSTRLISRATERASPSRARATRVGTSCRRLTLNGPPRSWRARRKAGSRGGHLDDQRVALPAATTQTGRAQTAAAALELQRQGQHQPGAGHADRVTERDRPAVDVDDLARDAELAHRLDAHLGERLVDLDQVEVGHGLAGLGQRVLDGVGRLGLQRAVRAGHVAVRDDLGEPGEPELLGLGPAHHHDRGGAVGDRRGAAGGDRSVPVEGRAELAERLGGRLGPDSLVRVDQLVNAPLAGPD